jgi:hypothetical protein
MNIAKILNNCYKGTPLYSPLCGTCNLIDIAYSFQDKEIQIKVESDSTVYTFDRYGRYTKTGEVILFPSKDKQNVSYWKDFKTPERQFNKLEGHVFKNIEKQLDDSVHIKYILPHKIEYFLKEDRYEMRYHSITIHLSACGELMSYHYEIYSVLTIDMEYFRDFKEVPEDEYKQAMPIFKMHPNLLK